MADLKFLAKEWPAVNRRLDEALSLAEEQRDMWLASLVETDAVKEMLRRLLDGAAAIETDDYLGALPKITLGPTEETQAHPVDAAVVGVVIGPYRLIRELGVGGMGQVWLAERVDGGLKRLVALKLPRLSWSSGLAERMSRERDILASLDHPNIARIYDAGLDERGRPYLALEYVEGEAIDVHCKKHALSVPDRLMLILQVARAVAHAHARLVVHRDLKPANILVTAEGQVRLLDFGIAKLMEGELTQETQLTQQGGRALTLDYASPEQIRGEPLGAASDVYSLAIVAYELLTEAKPYQLKRASAAALEEAIASVDVRLASTAATSPRVRSALKGDLDAVLDKALQKNVAERYATIDALAYDIERHLHGEPVLARPHSRWYRTQRWVRRHKAETEVQVSLLRKLLGPQIVATIPGRGYRFAMPLLDQGAAPRAPTTPTSFAASAQHPAAATPIASSIGPTTSPTNLPNELAPLYGRDGELAAVRALTDAHRLVTIVGTAGIGKTRLAQAVARQLCDRYADGVWMIELAAVADGASLPGSVAHALGIRLNGRNAPCDELVAALEAQRLLLVLDNCEHLLDAAATLLQAVLDRAAGTRLLVTSQAPLRLPAERLYRLEPLAVPQALDAAPLLDYGAVRLLTERVSALDRHFSLDDHNSAAVVDICRQLDGLPLAIELAAARVPLLGIQGVHERLGERLQMLTTGARSSAPRHQTLRAALDWSHGLLGNDDQVVFRRLGVFSGGCTIEAAQRVASDAQLDEWAVLESLGRLVDRSLVVAEGGDRSRLSLLDSVRAYAGEKLVDAGETLAWQRRHAEYFAACFETLADALYGGASTEGQFIQLRGVEIDNLREAIDASFGAHGDMQIALRLLVATAPMCHVMSLQTQAALWWRALSQHIDAQASPRQAALCRYGWIHWRLSVWPDNLPDWPQVAAWPLHPMDDARRLAHALWVQAVGLQGTSEFAAAYAALDEAGNLEAPDWPAWLRVRRLFFRAIFDREAGVSAAAPTALNDALLELESAGEGDGRWAFLIRTDLALECLLRGRIDEATQLLRALLELGRRQRHESRDMCWVLVWLLSALLESDSLDDARAVALEAVPHLKRSGLWPRFGPSFALLAAKCGRGDSAARMLGAFEAHLVRTGARRPRVVQRIYMTVLSMIERTHAKPQVDTWLAEGATLDCDAFARLIIESTR